MNVPQIEFLRIINLWLQNHENHRYATIASDTNPHPRNLFVILLGGWAINRYDSLRETDDIDLLLKERQLVPIAKFLVNTHGYQLISAPDSNLTYTRKMTFESKNGGKCFSLEARFLENDISFSDIKIDRDWLLLGSESFYERTTGALPFIKVPSQPKLIILKIISMISRPSDQTEKISQDFVDIVGVEKSLIARNPRYIDEIFLLLDHLSFGIDRLTIFVERFKDNKNVIKRDLQGEIDENFIINRIIEKLKIKPAPSISTTDPQLIRVRGSTFLMGSNELQEEAPTHKVSLKDFYIGKHLITFDEYDRFCEETNRDKPSDEGWGRGKRPVINVTWIDTAAYCNWLSEKNNLAPVYLINADGVTIFPDENGFKLPTEAQWEYGARGGSQDRGFKFSGSNNIDEVSWYEDNSLLKTHTIGEKKSNQLGIHDMSGNVWEWCLDNWTGNYESASGDGNIPYTEKNGVRMVRGGYYGSKPIDCRSTARCDWKENELDLDLGFRVCKNFK